jgi:hypothetical protein
MDLPFITISNTVWDNAAVQGNLDALKQLHSEQETTWSNRTCQLAARNGHLDCLMYLHEIGCPIDNRVCERAAENGNIECLKYAHEKCGVFGKAGIMASVHTNLDCLRYIYQNGGEINASCVEIAFVVGNLNGFEYLHNLGYRMDWTDYWNNFHWVCKLDCLRYAHEHGYPLTKEVYTSMKKSQGDCIQYLLDNGCSCDTAIQ